MELYYNQGFLRRFRDPIRVPRIEKRVPRIRENRVPTGPYGVPNVFLKKKTVITYNFLPFLYDLLAFCCSS